MFDTFLADKTTIDKNQKMKVARMPQNDDKFLKIITRDSVDVFLNYEKELQRIFTIYDTENYNQKNIMLTWEELALQNKKMTMWNLVRFLRDAKIINGSLSFENIT